MPRSTLSATHSKELKHWPHLCTRFEMRSPSVKTVSVVVLRLLTRIKPGSGGGQ